MSVIAIAKFQGDTAGFRRSFADPGPQAFIASIGADPAPPGVTTAEAVSVPGQS